MEIREIIDKIKKEYSEINWEEGRKYYNSNSEGELIVHHLNDLREKIHDKKDQKFLLIHYFAESDIEWQTVLQDYFTIIEITKEPLNGEFKLTVDNLGEDYFMVDRDFFKVHFIKVKLESDSYLDCIKKIIFKNFDDFVSNINITSNDWDDYGYRTVLNIQILGKRFILRVNPNNETTVNYLKSGENCPENFCSLGEVGYYEFLKKYLSYRIRQQWFSRTRDLAYNINVLTRKAKHYEKTPDAKGESFEFDPPYGEAHNFFNNSFMRNTTLKEIKEIYHPLTIAGWDASSNENETNRIKQSVDDRVPSIDYEFEDCAEKLSFIKHSNSYLPMNVYAIVGGNGSGKSYKIKNIITKHIRGDNKFSQILHFSLSPFDDDLPIDDDLQINDGKCYCNKELLYEKVGIASVNHPPIEEFIRKVPENCKGYLQDRMSGFIDENRALNINFLEKMTIKESFTYYIQNLLLDLIASPEKLGMWERSLEFFIFEPWVAEIRDAFQDRNIEPEDLEKIDKLSSGQATILLYLTKLVSSINQGSLIIFDEPETFMHPPMLKAFIRAVSEIVDERKAFCLIATHSPIVIQEIPHCNVYKLNLAHELKKINYKTYGQNLDTLYKNIYGVELQQTGYNSLFNNRRNEIIKKIKSEDIKGIEKTIIYESDEKYLGDEAFLKYLLLKDEIMEVGEIL